MNSTYTHKKVVVGSGLQALVLARCEDASIILTRDLAPHALESLESDFSSIGYTGRSALELYNSLLFSLSVQGRAPFAGKIITAEPSGTNELSVVLEGSLGECTIKFQHCTYFEPEISSDKKVVIDWINVRKGQSHNLNVLETEDEFVQRVYFYPSERVTNSKQKNLKDAVAVSLMTEEQLFSTDYSEFIARKKVKYLMELAGVRGPKNGKDPNDTTKQKYYSIKLEPNKREVYPLILSKTEIPATFHTSRDVFLSLGSR